MALERNSRIYRASQMATMLDTRVVTFLLAFLSVLGGFSLLLILLPLPIGHLDILLSFFVFVATLTLPPYIFIRNYFYQVGSEADMTKNDLYERVELSLVPLVDQIRKGDNPANILGKLIDLPKNRFILKEIFFPVEFFTALKEFYQNQPLDIYNKIIDLAFANGKEEKTKALTAGDLLYGYLASWDYYQTALQKINLDDNDLKNVIAWSNQLFDHTLSPRRLTDTLKASGSGIAQNWSSGYSLFLDRFGTDITTPIRFGNSSVEGRENIIMEIENALTKAGSNSCILTGAVGVGKTSLVYGLAKNIYWGQTTEELAYKRIFSLDISSLLSGYQNQGEAVQRLNGVLNDAVHAGNVILLIDGIDNIFSASREGLGTIDATEVIMPYLTGSSLKVIGITTDRDYQTYIAPKSALAGAFQKIEVPEANDLQTMRILQEMSLVYGSKYNLAISYNALKEIYTISDRFVTNKAFPAKAVDILNSLSAAAKSKKMGTLDRVGVQNLAGELLNAPIGDVAEEEKKTLLNLEEKLHQRMVGQEEAVKAVSNALRRARAKVGSSKRPIGNFLFLGPTGVGKTELSKTLAWAYFGSENSMIRMDMNEFQTKEGIGRFIGAKVPGRDELEGGDFIKKVRNKPFSVVLLDEIEKAHPDILNLFLQMLDEGYLNDGMGEKTILTNCIIIATSNAGANLIREGVMSKVDLSELKEKLLDYLQTESLFRPEFINRFDDVVLFQPLTEENLTKIGQLMFDSIVAKMKGEGYRITIDEDALAFIVKLGYKPEFGAREIRRVFQDKVESFIAQKVLAGEVEKGSEFRITLNDINN